MLWRMRRKLWKMRSLENKSVEKGKKFMKKEIEKGFEFRNIRSEEAEEAAMVEQK